MKSSEQRGGFVCEMAAEGEGGPKAKGLFQTFCQFSFY